MGVRYCLEGRRSTFSVAHGRAAERGTNQQSERMQQALAVCLRDASDQCLLAAKRQHQQPDMVVAPIG